MTVLNFITKQAILNTTGNLKKNVMLEAYTFVIVLARDQ